MTGVENMTVRTLSLQYGENDQETREYQGEQGSWICGDIYHVSNVIEVNLENSNC